MKQVGDDKNPSLLDKHVAAEAATPRTGGGEDNYRLAGTAVAASPRRVGRSGSSSESLGDCNCCSAVSLLAVPRSRT